MSTCLALLNGQLATSLMKLLQRRTNGLLASLSLRFCLRCGLVHIEPSPAQGSQVDSMTRLMPTMATFFFNLCGHGSRMVCKVVLCQACDRTVQSFRQSNEDFLCHYACLCSRRHFVLSPRLEASEEPETGKFQLQDVCRMHPLGRSLRPSSTWPFLEPFSFGSFESVCKSSRLRNVPARSAAAVQDAWRSPFPLRLPALPAYLLQIASTPELPPKLLNMFVLVQACLAMLFPQRLHSSPLGGKFFAALESGHVSAGISLNILNILVLRVL